MKRADFKYRFQVNQSAAEVFDRLCQVAAWWTNDMEGVVENVKDEFTVHFGESFVTMEVIEMMPEKKMTWLVKNCCWVWLNNKTAWNGTTIVWEISTQENTTQLNMTHVGLVPGNESYEICKEGWGLYIGNSLFGLITEGHAIPFEKNCQQ